MRYLIIIMLPFVGNGGGFDGVPVSLGNIANADYGFIGNGQANTINNASCNAFIGNGFCNVIGNSSPTTLGTCFGVIAGGYNNLIDSNDTNRSSFNSIVGGAQNTIAGTVSYGTIGGGACNVINGTGRGAFIGGGSCNAAAAPAAFIGAGSCNISSGLGSAVVGGLANAATGLGSFVGNGGDLDITFPVNNQAQGNYSFIGNGQYNKVDANSNFSFIGNGGGFDATTPAVSQGNIIDSSYSFIGTGYCNYICHSADMGFIGNGMCNNIVTGVFSSVINGICNTVNHSYATVSGYNVSSVMDCAMHINQLVLQDIPMGGAGPTPPIGAFPGSLWYYPDALFNKVVYVV